MLLTTSDGELIISASTHLLSPLRAYYMTVGDTHTYTVGESNIWVHNDCGPTKKKGKWDTPDNWANHDHDMLRDELRKKFSGFESGRHNEYPKAMRIELIKLANSAEANGVDSSYVKRLREIAETYRKREGAKHRGGR